MKKWFFSVIAAAMALVSCQESAPVNYLELVVGNWVCYAVDSKPLPTDSIRVVNFAPTFKYSEAYGVGQSDGRMVWVESAENSTFQVKDRTIIVTSVDGAKNAKDIKYKIEYISGGYMVCSIEELMINGVKQPATTSLYSFEQSVNVIRQDIPGIWIVGVPNSTDQLIWNFKAGGKYDFYLYDPINKIYKEKVIDKNTYKLYGRYLVAIYSGSNPSGEDADVWEISSFNYISMIWSSNHKDGRKETYRLARIQQLP